MEASEAQAAPQAAEATEAPQTGESQPEVSPALLQRLDAFQQEVVGRFGQLEERIPEPQQQESEPRYMRDEDTGDLYDARTGQLVDEGQLQRQQFMSEVQKMVEPLQQGLQQAQEELADYRVGDVIAEFPALEDPEVSGPFMDGVQKTAQEMGQPELAGNPSFVRQAWLAKLGAERAAGETPAQDPVQGGVETGSVSSPAAELEDPAKAIRDFARGGGENAGLIRHALG